MNTTIDASTQTSEKNKDFWTVRIAIRVNGVTKAIYERDHSKDFSEGDAITSFIEFLDGEIYNVIEE